MEETLAKVRLALKVADDSNLLTDSDSNAEKAKRRARAVRKDPDFILTTASSSKSKVPAEDSESEDGDPKGSSNLRRTQPEKLANLQNTGLFSGILLT